MIKWQMIIRRIRSTVVGRNELLFWSLVLFHFLKTIMLFFIYSYSYQSSHQQLLYYNSQLISGVFSIYLILNWNQFQIISVYFGNVLNYKYFTIGMAENLKVLYEDKYITITDCYILIKKYYMPLMTSKTIIFNEMKTISIQDARNVNNSWGINTNHLNNWFQYDPDRKKKNKFISIEIKNSRVRPAITPEDVDKAFDVLRNHFSEIDRKSVMFQSNRDKETEANQKQVHDNMKQQIEHEQQVNALKLETSQQELKNVKKEIKVQEVE